MKIALTGATGLVGSRFFDLLKSKYEIIPISSSFGVDITDRNKVNRFLKKTNPALIIHMAAKTNVDACEEDRPDDLKKIIKRKIFKDNNLNLVNIDLDEWKKSKSAFAINVIGTKNLADFASEAYIKMIYLSTDFVFDGEKDGQYSEEDIPNPINWYGQTKYWGEKAINGESLVLRISFPFGHKTQVKKDLIWTLADLLSKEQSVKLVSDQIITPTFIDDIIYGLDFLIDKKETGLINLVGNDSLSPYEIGITIAREFSLREFKIETTTRKDLYHNRARRPFKLILRNGKLRNLGFEMTSFFDALRKIKKDL